MKLTVKQRRYFMRQYRRRRKTTPAMRAAIARQWFSHEKTQLELALQWDVSQSTIARIVAGTFYRDWVEPKDVPAPRVHTATGETATTQSHGRQDRT